MFSENVLAYNVCGYCKQKNHTALNETALNFIRKTVRNFKHIFRGIFLRFFNSKSLKNKFFVFNNAMDY